MRHVDNGHRTSGAFKRFVAVFDSVCNLTEAASELEPTRYALGPSYERSSTYVIYIESNSSSIAVTHVHTNGVPGEYHHLATRTTNSRLARRPGNAV